MKLTKQQLQLYVVAGLIAIGALWLFLKKSGSIGFALGNGAVNAVSGVAGGLVAGTGSIVGIPLTNAQQCALCKRNGDTFGASKYCAAGDFLSWLLAGKPAQ